MDKTLCAFIHLHRSSKAVLVCDITEILLKGPKTTGHPTNHPSTFNIFGKSDINFRIYENSYISHVHKTELALFFEYIFLHNNPLIRAV